MIQVRKIIYWHFAVYQGNEDSIDPANLPEDAISSLDMSQDEVNPILVNASVNIRAFSIITGHEWLVDIYVSDGETQDVNASGKRTTIRTNNPSASGGFAWFDLSVAELRKLFGTPVVVDNMAQLSPDATADGGRARKTIQYILFGAHKEGESGAQLRSEPDAFFDFEDISDEVSAATDQTYAALVDTMKPKVFVDSEGADSGFYIKIKSHPKVTKLGCCNLDLSSSSSSGSSSSSSSSSSSGSSSGSSSSSSSSSSGGGGGGGVQCSAGTILRAYPSQNNSRRIWAVRQTVDIHASNSPVYEGGVFDTDNALVARRKIFSELAYVDVDICTLPDSSYNWSLLKWNHAGYISFRNQPPEIANLHILPQFNKSDQSTSSGNITAYAPYDYNYELPITVQAITWDDRGYLWALCSGGATDETANASSTIQNVRSTEGVYRLIPGGWDKTPADILCWGGTNLGKVEESDCFNTGYLADMQSEYLQWGIDRSGKNEFLTGLDTQFNIRIWQNKQVSSISFMDDSSIKGDNGHILKAKYISAGIDRICAIDMAELPYVISQNSTADDGIMAATATARGALSKYKKLVSGREFVVGLTTGDRLTLFVNEGFENSSPTQGMLDDLVQVVSSTAGDFIVDVECGDSFVSVRTNKNQVHIRGYMNSILTYDIVTDTYNPSLKGTILTTDLGTKTFTSISAFGDFLFAIAYDAGAAEGASFSLTFATVLKSYSLHSTNSEEPNSTIGMPEWYVFNQIKSFYSCRENQVVGKLPGSASFPVVTRSKGLVGVDNIIDVNGIPVTRDVFDSQDSIHSPYFGTSGVMADDLKAAPSLFGREISTSHSLGSYAKGTFVAISAPSEGGENGASSALNGEGAVYIFKRGSHELEFIQKITSGIDNTKNFGKKIAFIITQNSSDQQTIGLVCAYRDVNGATDKVKIYVLNADGDEFNLLSGGIIQTVGEQTNDDQLSLDCEITKLYSSERILVVIKSFDSQSTQYISIINTADDMSSTGACSGTYIKNAGARQFSHHSGVSIIPEQEGVTLVIGDPLLDKSSDLSYAYNSDASGIIATSNQNLLGSGGVILFYLNASNIAASSAFLSEDDDNSIIHKVYGEALTETETGNGSALYGHSIVCDGRNLFVSAPHDSTYSDNESGADALQVGSVFAYETQATEDLGSREVILSTSQKIKITDLKDQGLNDYVSGLALKRRMFGMSLEYSNGYLCIGACDNSDNTGKSGGDDIYPGLVTLLCKDYLGNWSLVSSSNFRAKQQSVTGDRFGFSLATIDIGRNGFALLVGSPGFVKETTENGNTSTINATIAGVVRIMMLPADSAIGALPSMQPSRLKEKNNPTPDRYDIKPRSQCLGRRHKAVILSDTIADGSVKNNFIYKYTPARLLERADIGIATGVEVPKFRAAKYRVDPVTGDTIVSTYSDLGAFSMEEDLKNVEDQSATDITVAYIPLHDLSNRNIRVLEMHPRPYKTVDISSASNATVAIDAASSDDPIQIKSNMFDWATPVQDLVSGSIIYLYAPVLGQGGSNQQYVGVISNSSTFGCTPIRADRWTIPISEMSTDNFGLYASGLAIKSIFSGSGYQFKGGYYVVPRNSFIPVAGTPTDSIGNPIIKPTDININLDRWWTSGGYYSPGCIQIVDAGREGEAYNYRPNPNSYDQNVSQRTNIMYNAASGSKAENVASIKNNDVWSYKMAEGSWNGHFKITGSQSLYYQFYGTRKFLGWSACSLDTERYNIGGVPNGTLYSTMSDYEKCGASSDPLDFIFGHKFSKPTVQILSTSFDNNVPMPPNLSGWSNARYQGAKDPVIHGIYNYTRFNRPTSNPTAFNAMVADRKSSMITYLTGYGAKVQSFSNAIDNFAFFTPQLRFTSILDRRLSSWQNWKTNFGGTITTGSSPANIVVKPNPPTELRLSSHPLWVSTTSSFDPDLDSTIAFNSCVSPTDTIYITDIFFNSSNRAASLSPSQIQGSIYQSCFQSTLYEGFETKIHRNELNSFTHPDWNPAIYLGSAPSPSSIDFSLDTIAFAHSYTDGSSYKALGLPTSPTSLCPLITTIKGTKANTGILDPNSSLNTAGWLSSAVLGLEIFKGYIPSTTLPSSRHSFDYPYATSILTGRGRNVQVSPFGKEVRSIGRDEIIFQNEFIYRKLCYHAEEATPTSTLPFGVPRYGDANIVAGSATPGELSHVYNGTAENIVKYFPHAAVIADLDIETDIIDDEKIIIRRRSQTSFVPSAPDSQYYHRHSIYDRAKPKNLFNEISLICIPTFSLPNLRLPTSSHFNHIFGICNSFVTPPTPDYLDSTQESGRSNIAGINAATFTNNASNMYAFGAGGVFEKAITDKMAHVIDINSSTVSLDSTATSPDAYLLTTTILVSLNAIGSRSDADADTSSLRKSSFNWQNGIDQSMYGGGLICAVLTTTMDSSGRIGSGSWKSTFSLYPALQRDAGVTTSGSSAQPWFMAKNQWIRNGIWMQPLIGLGRSADTYNNPHYWPGNFPWANSSDIADLGPGPGDITYPQYFHSPPGLIKVPINRSFISKMGKHTIVLHKGADGSSKWFAAIGPLMYGIDNVADLKNGPLSWAKKSRMTAHMIPEYTWDSRKVIFQRFGFTKLEMQTMTADKLFSFDQCSSDPTDFRIVRNFYSQTAFARELSAIPPLSKIESEMIDGSYFAVASGLGGPGSGQGAPPDSAPAMLGEGVGFSVNSGQLVHAFIWWRDSFWKLTPSATWSGDTLKTQVTQMLIQEPQAERMRAAYALHRLSGSFNGSDRFVISGSSGDNPSDAFMYIFKFNGDNFNPAFTLEIDFPTTATTASSDAFNISAISPKCNQSWKYATWMSKDASILAVGNHRWSTGDGVGASTPSGNPTAFYIDVYKRVIVNNVIKYIKAILLSVPIANTDSPVDTMCQSIWGAKQATNGLWSIYACSGADPNGEDRNYLSNTNQDNSAIEKRFGRVHVFEAIADSGSSSSVIEINDVASPSDLEFANSGFANMNFWTMTPISAKNGMCGVAFSPASGMVVSTAGHLVKLLKGSGDNSWVVSKMSGQSTSGVPTNLMNVSRVVTPYYYFGHTLNNPNSPITYANSNTDIFKLSTISVPSCKAQASPGFQRMASKLAIVGLTVNSTSFDSIISISNSHLVSPDQSGVFDHDTNLTSPNCNPVYHYLQGKRSLGSQLSQKQIYNPSFRSWLCSFNIVDSSFGTIKALPYPSYIRNKTNEAHIIVKPPVPNSADKELYFAGLECAPLDGSPLYRDYNSSLDKIKGTLMQMDWHDVSGVLWWGGNDIYIMRSHKHNSDYIKDGQADTGDKIENHINSKTYRVDASGANIVGQNTVSLFEMPSVGNNIILNPERVTGDSIGIRSLGLSGPMAITVAACANSVYVKDNTNVEHSNIIPFLRRRDLLGPQRVGIVIDDSDYMDRAMLSSLSSSVLKITNATAEVTLSSSTVKNGEEFMIDSNMYLAYNKSTLDYNSKILNGQSGFSIPNIVSIGGEGASALSRKYNISSENTRWNFIINDISSSLDPKFGNVYNADKVFVVRKSFIYKQFGNTSVHIDPEWYYMPASTGDDVLTHKVGLLECACGEKMRESSRYISKWKTNQNSSGADSGDILDMLVKRSVQQVCKLLDSVDTPGSQSDKLKDLVLIGVIDDTIIGSAMNNASPGTTSMQGLMAHIYYNIYIGTSGTSSLMTTNGRVHIIDMKDEKMSDLKLSFIREFQLKFNGTYTAIKGQ